jgi:photosystem II stability/assembly factor-like uncharacterized protein
MNKILFAATYGKGVFKTEDEGEKWVACNNGLEGLFITSLIKKGATLFLGTRHHGVYKSNNEGEKWISINDTTNSRKIISLFNHGDLLLIGTEKEHFRGSGSGRGSGIYLSKDEGKNWFKSALPKTDAHHQTIFCFGAKGNKILAGSSQYLYQSEDKGRSWKAIKIPTHLCVTDIHLHGNQILIGTSGAGVFSSKNGEDWETLDEKRGNIRKIINAENALVMGIAIDGVKQDGKYINEGFFKPAIKSLSFHRGKLYAGTYKKGIWRYDIPKGNFVPPPNTSKQKWKDIKIYPNPVDNGQLTIEYELSQQATTSIQLYDSFGKRLAIISPPSPQFKGSYQVQYDMSHLIGGSYYLHLQLGERSISKPIIIIQ